MPQRFDHRLERYNGSRSLPRCAIRPLALPPIDARTVQRSLETVQACRKSFATL
jgi:hypothetical protein